MLRHVRFFVTPWTVAHQAPLSMEFSKQEYWSGLPFPTPADLPWKIEPASPASAGGFFTTAPPGKPVYMYLIFPKLPSNPGCHITLSALCYTVGPCWLSTLNMAVYTCPCPNSLSLPPSFRLATISSPTNHPELLGNPSRVCGVSFLRVHELAVPNSWNALPCILLW